MDLVAGIDAGVDDLLCSRIEYQRHLHILDKILGEGEHLISHAHGSPSAPEVGDLEPLIDSAAGLHCHIAAASNKAPSVQRSTGLHRNSAVRFHIDQAVCTCHITGGAARSRIVSATHTDPTVDGQRGSIRQGQGFVCRPGAASAVQSNGCVCVKSLGIIEGNE